MEHEASKVTSKLALAMAKSRQCTQYTPQDCLRTGTAEASCALSWERSRPDRVWVPPARRNTCSLLLAQESVWFIYNHSFSVIFSVLKHVCSYKKQESCGLLTCICIKPQINLPFLLFSIVGDD